MLVSYESDTLGDDRLAVPNPFYYTTAGAATVSLRTGRKQLHTALPVCGDQ
jgi:hypothetical protein